MKARLSSSRGSTSLVALIAIATLTYIAGSFIVRITSRSREAYHSASWIEASQMAESTVAVALVEIRRVLPQAVHYPSNAWTGWSASLDGAAAPLPALQGVPAGLVLSLGEPLSLTHLGEGNTTSTGTVSIDAPASLVDAAGRPWLRVRASGTATLPGSARASLSQVDRHLRRLAFVRDWSSGAPVASPQVSRSVECIVQPVTPFPGALQASGLIRASSSKTVIDSYDSTDARKSTGGEYDAGKSQSHGSVFTSDNVVKLAGAIHGNLSSNGAALPSDLAVSGTVSSSYYQPLAPVSVPEWALQLPSPQPVSSDLTLSASGSATPARYRVSAIAATLTLKAVHSSNGTLLPSKVEICVDGDVTGGITVESGVQATIYVGGNVTLKSSDLVNPSLQPANLQIYGTGSSGSSHAIALTMSSDLHASIYAPEDSLATSGTGDLMGSFTAKSIKLSGQQQVHYDESLASRAALTVDYRVASWIEDVQ